MPTSFDLTDKVALVTGAGRGLGAAIAKELASHGASVVVNYARSAAAAQRVVDEIEALPGKPRAIAIQADVTQPAEVTRLFETAIEHFGKIDIVMSNSGMEAFSAEEDVTAELYDEVFGLNTRAQFFVAQHALKYGSHGGRLILTSSVAAQMTGVKNHALYAGSKAAVEGFTRSFAADCGPKKMTVNAVAPGGIYTDMYLENSWHYAPDGYPGMPIEQIDKGIASLCPLGRTGKPLDVARVVAFLSSAEGEWINGQVIKLTGGSSA
ncbi:putative versicolorin reductase [Aspergillus brunneoviolaceus CBS 621.78]|uniref:Versicolorin reductase n=1 Tax=Aspergillus brunneoviolaceus CBS 621.78 TaxID=1450534 RepID=A0ACD1G5M1_9EURO|nr:putative versicolorin reductase [Aspergillus brunneoviolaceus CBS 621.78]RAH44541.1 putative versicolorin reductase [Aspergillus brunneoviolaceus CBS 621.78]